MTDARINALPDRTRQHLDRLCTQLATDLGDKLQAILAFGSLARGAFDAERSDIDLVIVLRDDPPKALRSIGAALDLARNAARIEAILLRGDELDPASDVFPLFYDDIRRCNIVLHGSDPFAGLEIHDEHRRLRIEQELREARIRLRRAVAESGTTPMGLPGAIDRKVKQMRGPLHALLRLRGVDVGDELPTVLGASAKRWNIDLGPLSRAREATDAALDALVGLLDAAIRDVDSTTEDKNP
jgi:predicted nucleotidyltransferase